MTFMLKMNSVGAFRPACMEKGHNNLHVEFIISFSPFLCFRTTKPYIYKSHISLFRFHMQPSWSLVTAAISSYLVNSSLFPIPPHIGTSCVQVSQVVPALGLAVSSLWGIKNEEKKGIQVIAKTHRMVVDWLS